MVTSSNNGGHRPKQQHANEYFSRIFTILLLVLLHTTVVWSQQPQLVTDRDEAYYYVGCYTERTDLFKESVYSKTPQICIDICEIQHNKYAVLSAENCFCSNDTIRQDLQHEQLCNTRCLVNKLQYCGGVGMHSYYSTSLRHAQPAPNNLRVVNSTENTLTIEWDSYEPRKLYIAGAEATPLAQITNFLIKTTVVHTYSSLPFFLQPEFIVQSTETRFEITDLQPATEYNVTVKAMCGRSMCGSADLIGSTLVDVPSPAPAQPRILEHSETTLTVEIKPIKNNNGPVSNLLIIVERLDDALSQPFDTELLGTWQKAQDDGLPYYIAAELDYDRPEHNRTRRFIIGDGKRYGRYENVPIVQLNQGEGKRSEKDPHVHVSLGVVSTLNGITKILYTRSTHDQHSTRLEDFSYATFDKGPQSIVALAVTCIVFGTCLVLSLIAYFYLRYKTCQNRGGLRNAHEMTLQQPIIERENNGFIVEDEQPPTVENFKQQLDTLVDRLELMKRLPRNALRMNVNDVIGEGSYGEVITGKLISSSSLPSAESTAECQLHVLALDELSSADQAHLLREFRNLTQLRRHENLLDFYGISASTDWFYFVFEQQQVTLKRRLIESRRAPNSTPVQRITTLSEELVLQWIYEIASAMEYLSSCKVLHRKLCSHNTYVTADSKLKLSIFGPIHYINNQQKQVDLTRWLAPEVLRYQHYSTKSDVWAFACVAWECCALGGTPYAHINNSQQLLDAIKSGSRPAQPAYVYQDLYQLLLNCWQLEPSERITFEDIAFSVRQLMTSARHALSFDRAPEMTNAAAAAAGANQIVDTLPFYMPMLEMATN